MNISFKTKKLQKIANDDKAMKKELGGIRAQKFQLRLQQILAADTLEDLRYVSGKYHELTGDRKGQWACSLDGPYRLIFEPYEDPIPSDENGRYLWIEIKEVEMIEIVDYH